MARYEFDSSAYVQVDCIVRRQTDRAINILIDEAEPGGTWVPKSVIDGDDLETIEAPLSGRPVRIGVASWFAEKEGLV